MYLVNSLCYCEAALFYTFITNIHSISACDDKENLDKQGNCTVYASWLGPLCMFVFLLVANILMVNLLIARFK